MKTQTDTMPEPDLEALFAQARAQPPQVDPDAQALQPRAPAPTARPRARRPGFWTRLAAVLGGATAVAGLGTAAMAGLLIGYVQPEPMVALADSMGFGISESLDLRHGFDALLAEDMLQ